MGLLLLMGGADYNIRSELFSQNEQGLWLDPSQMSTLYQDANGVTPCTAAGDPVGLILDQRQGALTNLGAELTTNGGFDSDTWWSKGAGVTIAAGVCQYTAVALNAGVFRTSLLTAGKFYVVDFTVSGLSSGGVRVYSGGNRTSTISTNGTYRLIVLAGSSDASLIFEATSAGTTLALDNVSVREVPGNHAYQSTSGARPTLARVPFGGRRNLLTRTEEFDNAVWLKNNVNVTANTVTSPSGSMADLCIPTVDNTTHFIRQISLPSNTYTFSCYLKAAGETQVSLWLASASVAGIFTLTGAGSFSGAGGLSAASIEHVGDGWYLCQVWHNVAGTTVHVYGRSGSAYIGNGTDGFYIADAQAEATASLSRTTYQRVTSTHDVTESGQADCWALSFDGSDDHLLTNAIDFAGWTQETRRNLLFEGDQFDATGWTKINTTITPNAIANPVNGAVDADLMVDTTGTGAHNVTRSDFNCIAGQAYTCSCYVKAAGNNFFQMVITSNVVVSGFANFDLQNGVVGSKAAGVTSTYMVDLGNGWYRCVAEFTSASTTTGIINFATVPSAVSARAQSYTGDGVSGVYLYGGQWEAGTLTTYQRVGTDEMTVIAGVRKLSDAADGQIVELSTGSAAGRFSIGAPGSSTVAKFQGVSVGSAASVPFTSSSAFNAPITVAISLLAKISTDYAVLEMNGVQVDSKTTDQGSGNYSNNITYIGRRGGSTLPFNGLLHHLIIRGKTTEGSKLTGAEKLTGKKSGLNI